MSGTSVGAGVARQPLGAVFILAIIWLLFDIGRPPTPPGLPLLITAVLFFDWLGKKNKQWSRWSVCWLVFLGGVAIGLPFAPNTYAVGFNTRLMGTLFLGMCLPLQGLISSVRRARVWIYGLIGVAFYVGFWAATHHGFGPAASNGQDENYVATLMSMGVGLAYFAFMGEHRFLWRVVLGLCLVVFVAAMAMAENPSRGGFLALCCVALYCLYRSPRKLLGIAVLASVGLALMLFAGPSFWNEIDTTTDYESGTGDMRLELWQAGVRMFKAKPIAGVGSGNFRWVIGDYEDERQYKKFGRSLGGSIIAHSMHVEMLAELGLLGVVPFWILVVTTWLALGKLHVPPPRAGRPPPDPRLVQLSWCADAIRASLIGALVSGVFLSLCYYSHAWVLLAVGGALPFVHARVQQQIEAGTAAGAVAPPPPRRRRG